MKKKCFLILLSIIACFVFNIINANACLNNAWSCDSNIIVQRSSGRNYIGEKYYYFTYARQLTHNNVYCIKNGASGPTSKICSLENNMYGNATRAAIGYIIHNYDDNYGKAQYLIHRILELREGGKSVLDYSLYQDEYHAAAQVAVDYENSVPATYYLANLYNCGSGIQPIAEGYETITPNKVEIAYHPNGGTTTLPKNDYGWIKYNNKVYFHTLIHGEKDDPYNASTLGLTRTGYKFSGWKVYSTGTILDQNTEYHSTTYAHYNDKNKTTANTKEVTCYLYAQWTPDNYKIIYHGNGGRTSSGQIIVEDSISYNSNYAIRSGDLFTQKNHTFIGWTTNPQQADDGYNWTNWAGNWTYTNGQYGIENNELHLYARWQDSCVYEFINTYNNNPSKTQRIKLYETYRDESNNISRRNLLNFRISDAEGACGNHKPNYNLNNSCLTTDQVSSDVTKNFTHENISDYNDKLKSTSTDDLAYCLTDFELGSNVDIKSNANAGQMIYSAGENEAAITAKLTKTCFVPTSKTKNYDFLIEENNYYTKGEIKNTFKYLKGYKLGKDFYYKINPGDFMEKKGTIVKRYSRFYEVINKKYILNKTNCPTSYKYQTLDGNDVCITDTSKIRICYDCNLSSIEILYNPNIKNSYLIHMNRFLGQYTKIDDIYVKNTDRIKSTRVGVISNNYLNYNDYITDVYLDGDKLSLKESIQDPVITTNVNGELTEITGEITVNYTLQPKYVYKLSGRTEDKTKLDCYDEANNKLNPSCSIAGYGVISNFKDGDNTNITNNSSFDFRIDNSNANSAYYKFDFTTGYDNKCPYTVSPEIIKYDNNSNGNLELEFRSIDKNQPFNRKTNSNWCDEESCASDNNTVQSVIKERNDSYNRTGAGALYTTETNSKKIILTPDIIKDIREWNDTHSYDKYEVVCDDNGLNCRNAFLSRFEISRVP